VDRMVKDAEQNADQDKKQREAVDTKNQADSLIYQTEKQLKELGDKVPAEIKTKVEAKVNELKEVAAKDDVEATKKALDELQKEVLAIGQAMYDSQPPAGGAGGPEGAPGAGAPGADDKKGGDNVVDAEFTDSDK